MKIDITGLDKAAVLLALYNNALFSGPGFAHDPSFGIMSRMTPAAPIDAAVKEIERRSGGANDYFDYIDLGSGSKPLKVDLSGFDFESDLYDHDHGEGAAQRAISPLWRPAGVQAATNSAGFFFQVGERPPAPPGSTLPTMEVAGERVIAIEKLNADELIALREAGQLGRYSAKK